ncbi:MAG TPA: hypothetical protein VNO79_15545 [Actinomycetota bacterium]|nr:hypothetical protein [Actinomycetota bacterium]
MRRLAALLLSALSLAACAPHAAEVRPNALEQISPTLGLDVAAARQAAISFVEAYARADEDGAAALRTFAGTPKMLRWAEWVGVQAEQFPGEIIGRADVERVAFVGFLRIPAADALGAHVDLDATVSLTFVPEEGEPARRVRVFRGPVALFRRDLADWGVLNAIRDGLSMDDEIHLVDQRASARGVSVELDSVFTFAPEWSVNLVISNGTRRRLALFPPDAAIVDRAGGRVDGLAGTPNLRRIPAGTRRMAAIVTFPALGSVRGRTLVLPVRLGGGREVRFEFPLGRLLRLSGDPSPSPSPG